MNRASRILVLVPSLFALGWLAVHALAWGTAASTVFNAGVSMKSWSSSPAQKPADGAMDAMRDSLKQAEATVPRDPAIHELLGLIAVRSGNGQEYLPEASVHFSNAIQMRPTSPQSWGSLAVVKYVVGDTAQTFERAIDHAAALGRFEPDVQAIVANYGLAAWNEIGPRTRGSVEATIAAAMKRNPLEILRIAERRGRLDIACRHLAGSTRQVDPKWSRLCQSMEATP